MSFTVPPAPIVFTPILMERVWGGRLLESLYRKSLPPGRPVGESWEIVDRAEAQSMVRDGVLTGTSLHELWLQRREEIFGPGLPDVPRFPLLLKLLDARESLSLQVHPTAEAARALGGEEKTEMWYITHAEPGAQVFAGLRPGTTRESWAEAIASGRTADLVHHFPAHAGEGIYVPSGRIHALGAGTVVVEIMQNSDTTYRVFDWNRLGLDGRPRPLQVEPSMRSIRFDDHAPGPLRPEGERLVQSKFFQVEKWSLSGSRKANAGNRFAIFTVLSGRLEFCGSQFQAGEFFLVPVPAVEKPLMPLEAGTEVLQTTLPD